MRKYALLFLAALLLMAGAVIPAYAAGGAWSATWTLTQATDNQASAAIALPGSASIGGPVKTMWVTLGSAITSSTTTIQCSPDGGTTYYPFYAYHNNTNIIGGTTAAAVTAVMFQVAGDVSACTHVKVYFGTAQAADETGTIYGR